MSSSTPNLTNIPSRDEELAPLLRGLFIPDHGHARIRKHDYSQVEYRLFVHFAIGEGSHEARIKFCEDPNIDYHDWVLSLVAPVAGWDVSTPAKRKHWRKPVKNINFGLLYSMGKNRLATNLHLSQEEADKLFSAYHKGVPFVKPTSDHYTRLALETGEIRTLLGRKSRFELWEPSKWTDGAMGLPYEKARAVYGEDLRRAQTHKALNRLLQGGAADVAKMALLRCWREGVFAETGVPRIFVHDEFVFSDPGTCDKAFAEMQHIMETSIPLRVPLLAEGDAGPDWGHCKALAA